MSSPRLLLAGESQITLGERMLCAHAGRSMNPTLCERDLLEITPYASAPRLGDVILFRDVQDGLLIAHRIVRITPSGIHTQGDASSLADAQPPSTEQILGRVVAAYRGPRRRLIVGGWAGLQWHWLMRCWGKARSLGAHLPRPLMRAGIVGWLLPARLRPRVVAFSTKGTELRKLVWRNHVLGQLAPGARRWRIHPLLRLLFGDTSLPTSDQKP